MKLTSIQSDISDDQLTKLRQYILNSLPKNLNHNFFYFEMIFTTVKKKCLHFLSCKKPLCDFFEMIIIKHHIFLHLIAQFPLFTEQDMMTFYLPIHLSIFLPINQSIFQPFNHSNFLSTYQPINLSIFIPIHPSIFIPIHTSIILPIHLSIFLPIIYLSF